VNTAKQIGLLAFRVIGLVAIVIALLIATLWARMYGTTENTLSQWNRKHLSLQALEMNLVEVRS
jgi:hypothetical protein